MSSPRLVEFLGFSKDDRPLTSLFYLVLGSSFFSLIKEVMSISYLSPALDILVLLAVCFLLATNTSIKLPRIIFFLVGIYLIQFSFQLMFDIWTDAIKGGRLFLQLLAYILLFHYVFNQRAPSRESLFIFHRNYHFFLGVTILLEIVLNFILGSSLISEILNGHYRSLGSPVFVLFFGNSNAASPNSIFLGPQHSSIITLCSLLFFFYAYRIYPSSRSYKLLGTFCLVLFAITFTSTSFLCLLCGIYFLIRLRFKKRYLLDLICLGFFTLSAMLLFYLDVGAMVPENIRVKSIYYVRSFGEPFRTLHKLTLSELVFGRGTAISRGQDSILASHDFGLMVNVYAYGFLVVIITVLANLYFIDKISSFLKRSISDQEKSFIIGLTLILIVQLVSLFHYQTVYTEGLRIYVCFCIYSIYLLIKNSPSTESSIRTA